MEIQLQTDRDKLRSWPLYQAAARAQYECDACLLVVALTERVARWARKPIPLGPGGSVFRAIVFGPSEVPHHFEHPTPELSLLSGLAHDVGEAFERALERLMATTEHKYLSDWARKYYDEGEAAGLRTAIIALFSARRLPLSDGGRARIAACSDIATLTKWHERAVTVSTEAEIFAAE